MSKLSDLISILRALQIISKASVKLQEENLKFVWKNSSLKPLAVNLVKQSTNKSKGPKSQVDLPAAVLDSADRVRVVLHGLKEFTAISLNSSDKVRSTKRKRQPADSSLNEFSENNYQKVNSNQTYSNAPTFEIELTESDQELLRKLDMEHRQKLKEKEQKHQLREQMANVNLNEDKQKIMSNDSDNATLPKSKPKLSENAKQRKVPSSRIGRMVSFGTLAAGLGIGTAGEYVKRSLGLETRDGNLFMSKANLDRIVDTLCKVRGAALKLGQILSIQDESVVSPELAQALERVRKSADFMPDWQVEQVMSNELGLNWFEKFSEFEKKPFAAASIGQVHAAKLKDGREVAVKIQYPGVAKGIESDIDNLGSIMKMWNIFPKGMFLENLMAVAKRELAWEVDYIREAECTRKFKEILKPYKDYYVPDVIGQLSTKQVFTTEMLDGIPVDQCFDMPLEHRRFIAQKILELVLLEILTFRYMQTDPNWANFLYNPQKKQVLLLDFGASREYSKEFIDKYVKILKGACDGDKDAVLKVSRELGFLTGYESKIMEDAHVDAVMILGEVFRCEGNYNFADQDMTFRIQNLAQTMLDHRLCPPPEEIYSLHRKLSGVFLLCTKLRVSMPCRSTFLAIYKDYIARQSNHV